MGSIRNFSVYAKYYLCLKLKGVNTSKEGSQFLCKISYLYLNILSLLKYRGKSLRIIVLKKATVHYFILCTGKLIFY